MSDWCCTVTIGDDLTDSPHVFEITADPADVDQETPTVLDDLRFGWKMPKGAIWPDQPDPMIADLSLNLPAFYDYADIVRGTRVAIEFSLFPIDTMDRGGLLGAFYGRITDAVAQPRNTTPGVDEYGVTLDITAVDYTVDTREAPDQYLLDPTPGATFDEVSAVQAAFAAACGGYLPVTGGPYPDAWSSPNHTGVSPEQEQMSPRGLIDQVLREAVNMDALPPTRMILAPIITDDRQLPTARSMTLDTVTNATNTDSPDYVIDADNVDVAVKWTSIKGASPDYVTVYYGAGSITAPPLTSRTGDALKRVVGARIDTYFPYDAGYTPIVEDIAYFYGRDNSDDDPWTMDTVTVFVDTLDDSERLAFPHDFFPRVDLAEGNATRASCYSRTVLISGIEPSVSPNPILAAPSAAVLVGAELRVSSGRPELTLNLRYNQKTH